MNTIREQTETLERLTLSRYAALSQASRGRRRPEPPDPMRPCYQRDRDRIIHCKAFRRLKQKTQVFLSPEGDHYRTRLCPGGFAHYRQSLRVVDVLEKEGRGLNLSWEVRNGIVTHTKGAWARTMEGRTVRIADHIAFLNHDIEDAVSAGVLDAAALPGEATRVLGVTKSQRITTMITDLVAHSPRDTLQFSPEVEGAYNTLKDFMYATVYVDKEAKREEKKVDKLVGALYERLCAEPDLMPNFYLQISFNEGIDRAVADYISGMSDEFATHLFEELFVPKKWAVL